MIRLKSGQRYTRMPSLDGAVSYSGRLNPAKGRASLTLTDPSSKGSVTWTFRAGSESAKRWLQLGVCPVVWQFTPPRNLPFLNYGDRPCRATAVTIVVARDVDIEARKTGQFTSFMVERPTRGAPTMSTNPGAAISRALNPLDVEWVHLAPTVKIIHVQNSALMPEFDRPDSIMGAIGSPYLLVSLAKEVQSLEAEDFDSSGDISKAARMELGLERLGGSVPGLAIVPQWNKVAIRSLMRDFTISITVKNHEKPAAFAHAELQSGAVTIVYVHANDNVNVTVDSGAAAAARKRIWVFVRSTPLDQVPAQGEALDRTLRLYKRVEIEEALVPGEIKFLIELAISFVPVVGTLYDLGQLAYMVATGRDFWGDRASASDILLGGSLTLVSIAAPLLRRGMSVRPRNAALTDLITGAGDIADLVPPGLVQSPTVEALRHLPDAEMAKVVRKIEDAIASGDGAAAAKAMDGAVQQALRSVDEPTRQALTDRMVKDLFTPDLGSFRNTVLRVAYDFYKVSRKGKLSPLAWLLDAKGMWVNQYMAQLFEAKWKNVVAESFGLGGKRVIPLTQEMLTKYDDIIRKGLDEYSVHQKAVGKVPGLGQHFELDHIIEQRFMRRFEEWTDALPEDAALMTFIVPKNAGVAAEIVRVDPSSSLIKYVHQAKTDVMRRLVPHGAEHLFSVQQIADATLYALKSLDAHHAIPVKALKGDFAILTLAHAKNVDAHLMAAEKGFFEAADELGMPTIRGWDDVTDELVSVAAGFPQVERVNGVWRLAGTP